MLTKTIWTLVIVCHELHCESFPDYKLACFTEETHYLFANHAENFCKGKEFTLGCLNVPYSIINLLT